MNAARKSDRRLWVFIFCGFLYLAPLSIRAEAPESNLVDRSPFLPPDFGKNQETLNNTNQNYHIPSQVEFVGYSGFDGNWKVALLFTQSKEVHWLKPGEMVESIRLVDFDPQRGVIQINERNVLKIIHLNAERPLAQDAPPPIRSTQNQKSASPPGLNPQATNNADVNTDASESRRGIPRRRIILPKK